MSVLIRLIEEKDLQDILEISALSFSLPWSEASYIQELSNPVAKYLVAVIDNKVVGFAGTWIVLDESHITNIAVHPNYRNQQIGSKLLEELLKYCNSLGCTKYELEVRLSNKAAQALYSKYGFKENGIRKGYYADNKEDAILMWLQNEKSC